MSADGSVTLIWGDGEHRFRLGIGELRELEQKRGAGSEVIMNRIFDGSYFIDDVRETMRMALIGGGLDATRALAKIGKYVGHGQIAENRQIAGAVIFHGIYGDKDDRVGKMLAALATENSDGQSSSETPRQWVGPSPSSTNAASGNMPRPSTDGTGATGQMSSR